MPTISSISSGAENVASMATNLEIGSVLKIKMKKKKNIRKWRGLMIKTENLMGYATIVAEKGMSKDCQDRKYGSDYKNSRKQKKLLMGMRMMWYCAC